MRNAFPSDACGEATDRMEKFLHMLPTACKLGSDCEPYYLNPEPCTEPVILAKPGYSSTQEVEMARLQGDVRRFCLAGKRYPACAPIVVPYACIGGRCQKQMR